MLIDYDMIPYLMGEPHVEGESTPVGLVLNIPERLAVEQASARNGSDPGRLMKQEKEFCRLMKDHIWDDPISRTVLRQVEIGMIRNGPSYMCYCRREWDRNEQLGDVLECSHAGCEYRYFHRSCVKDQGVGEVTQWYCNICDTEMRILARDTLLGVRK
jgi:hypothetical protein